MAVAGGIDLGGTKIEAKLFDHEWQCLVSKRIPTPTQSYDELLSALANVVGWLEKQAGRKDLPIGIGHPGYQSRSTGIAVTSNLPATGKRFSADLTELVGRELVFENDCNCLALSEAVLGAGQPYRSVYGVVLGTGVGAGFCVDGKLVSARNGTSGECGHIAISNNVIQECDLEYLACGCGRVGCYETYLAGPGMSRLAQRVTGESVSAKLVAERAAQGDPEMQKVLQIWSRIAADLVAALQCIVDPECIVLAGGLSKIPDVTEIFTASLDGKLLPHTEPPAVLLAQNGDSSGTRGAALAAYQQSTPVETTP